jgi:16S rRNA (cytosine1402-N4)-methyltransferase
MKALSLRPGNAIFREGIYSEIAATPVCPSAEEIYNNPRARSAKLRWVVKAV